MCVISVLLICNACKIENYVFAYTPSLVEVDNILKDDSEYIVVIGDIQIYTLTPNYYYYYASTMNWIWSQIQHGKNIKSVLQVGDITDNNMPQQYDIFYRATYPTAELIPFIACPGNHDYDWDVNQKITDRYSSRLSQYASFDSTKSRIVAQFETNHMENIVVENYINGERYDVISVEFGPRPEVVEWAKQYVKSHSDRRYILLTHEYLTPSGQRISSNSSAEFQVGALAHSTPEYIWQTLVKTCDSIVCVICGHNGFSRHLFSKNSHGRDVAQILFNLQYQPNGGDGWVQIWEFPKNSDYVNVDTYNTITRQYHSESHHSFQFKYKY